MLFSEVTKLWYHEDDVCCYSIDVPLFSHRTIAMMPWCRAGGVRRICSMRSALLRSCGRLFLFGTWPCKAFSKACRTSLQGVPDVSKCMLGLLSCQILGRRKIMWVWMNSYESIFFGIKHPWIPTILMWKPRDSMAFDPSPCAERLAPGPPSLQRCVRRLATTLFAPRLPRCFLRGEHRPRLAMMNVMIHHDVMGILGLGNAWVRSL